MLRNPLHAGMSGTSTRESSMRTLVASSWGAVSSSEFWKISSWSSASTFVDSMTSFFPPIATRVSPPFSEQTPQVFAQYPLESQGSPQIMGRSSQWVTLSASTSAGISRSWHLGCMYPTRVSPAMMWLDTTGTKSSLSRNSVMFSPRSARKVSHAPSVGARTVHRPASSPSVLTPSFSSISALSFHSACAKSFMPPSNAVSATPLASAPLHSPQSTLSQTRRSPLHELSSSTTLTPSRAILPSSAMRTVMGKSLTVSSAPSLSEISSLKKWCLMMEASVGCSSSSWTVRPRLSA
mmetsp:Transcript_9518/g.34024  ORF Transcript_9518/g.34024 Transcript_9518/m.34024 type:complete len:294 (+) Transcript_9518:56-937(+)